MFISFCLIVKYPWFLNQLSLNCGIVPGSGQTNDDVTSLMQICHDNNSISVILWGHTFQMCTYRKIMRMYLVPVR